MAQLFLELPGELLIQILSQLTLGELLSCKCVNRLLNEIVEESVVLQYVIETEAAGVRDNPRSHLATAERLDRLRRREDAMTRFRISHIRTVPVQIPTSGIYDLSGGVYLLGTAAPHDRSVTTGINCLRFQTIAETPEWSEIKIGFEKTGRRIIDIGLALQEHDLIALVTSSPRAQTVDRDIDLLLFNFSSSTCHTQARQPVIHLMSTTEDIALNLEIVGDHLALLLIFPSAHVTVQDRLYVYDWKSGRLNMTSSVEHNTYFGFVFLSENVLLLANADNECLDICHISPPGDTTKALNIAHSLSLPQMAPSCHILRILCRSDPNHIRKLSTSGTYSQAPFYSSPEDALVLFNLLVLERMHQVRSFSFLVHRRALLAHMPSSPSTPSHTPWKTWGPPVTFWFNTDDITTRWITTTHGQRWVITTTNAREVPCHIYMLDFNPYLVRRMKAGQTSTSSELSDDEPLVVMENDMAWDGSFAEPVVGRLPCVECVSSEKFDYDAVLLDEQDVIGMRLDDAREMVTAVDVLHFG